ncbi:MAG TPA: PepSY domain-containing protein [Actinoallomurus sp.]|nr:PepSY domain-containing protein [Actinoallomurus sp.]
MRKKAAITTGVAAAVLGGGLALALNGGGAASAAGTTAGAGAVSSARPTGSPAMTKISRSKAEQIALAAVPGGRVTSAELESEHGVPVWSVRVTDGGVRHDLDINAYTGKVIRDRDDDARPAAPERRHDRAREAEHRRGEAEPRDDHGREAEHRHGEAEPGDDHGRHGEGEDHHGGGDGGHRGRGR